MFSRMDRNTTKVSPANYLNRTSSLLKHRGHSNEDNEDKSTDFRLTKYLSYNEVITVRLPYVPNQSWLKVFLEKGVDNISWSMSPICCHTSIKND